MAKIFKFFIIGVLVIIGLVLLQDIFTQAKKFGEISQVEKQASDLEKKNKALKKDSAEAKTPFSLEQQARDKLGYQKPGETIYVADLNGQGKKDGQKGEQNWESWLNLFLN